MTAIGAFFIIESTKEKVFTKHLWISKDEYFLFIKNFESFLRHKEEDFFEIDGSLYGRDFLKQCVITYRYLGK